MASKGPRSKLDHESRAKRQKALEAPREPRRPKTHWDHVLEEMVWLSKDFESERKWKLSQAKKVALRASKGMLDQATRGEKKLKEEEQRLKKVALNISKDVKKFWLKIEKLVLYKHQMELDEKKKKALDKQLEFLLGQTERYSTMLAENLVDNYKPVQQNPTQDQHKEDDGDDPNESSELNVEPPSDTADVDDDYDIQSDDESEDDEQTIEEDEALITKEERQEELVALQNEIDLPLEELLKRYAGEEKACGDSMESSPVKDDGDEPAQMEDSHSNENELSTAIKIEKSNSVVSTGRRCSESNGSHLVLENHLSEVETCEAKNLAEVSEDLGEEEVPYDFNDEREDGDFVLGITEEKDDETTLSEEEEFAKTDSHDPIDEIALLQKESEIPIEELLSRYKKDPINDEDGDDRSEYASALSEGFADSLLLEDVEKKQLVVSIDENIEQKQGDENSEQKQSVSVVEEAESDGHPPPVHSIMEEQQAKHDTLSEGGKESEDIIADAAAAARSAQPTGNTFSTTKVRTKFPFLLKFPLREYQHIGLDWLVAMYEKRLNGILADEMGLGKTIMTIALLAHLACEKGIWGPHLIVVPTSVMLNWETEFLKWCPAFKILTYFGSAKERKLKRQGWLKPNSFHVCITTYRLVIQDSKVFKRKKWKYLILDEAHLIKNWKSQRWQTLLNFNSKRRILLTGTPLQNDLMELWSLMHFLMPHIFQSHQEFKDWFCNPIAGMVEGQEKVNKEVIDRLHNVLRPFILRRLKRDVEKQLPMKLEHVIYCRLSKRQRNLYEDFIASSETQATLANANFFGMISIIMQLRKVCNHPDLFEGRPIVSSFDMAGIDIQLCSSVCSALSCGPLSRVDLRDMGFVFTHHCYRMTSWESDEVKALATPSNLIKARGDLLNLEKIVSGSENRKLLGSNIFEDIQRAIMEERIKEAKDRAATIAWWNSLRCERKPMYSTTLRELVTVRHPAHDIHCHKANPRSYTYSRKLADIILSPVERFHKMLDLVESFMFAIPAARAPPPVCWCSKSGSSAFLQSTYKQKCTKIFSPLLTPLRPAIVRRQVYFPDRRLIQFDCGKLQELAILLRKLKSGGHRALIFTQMTKMLDVLEAFINLYGYTYMRLDGSTPPEERQTLMQRFNTNPKIFLFILSTRSGGVGINLVGADTVIFYDSDWNPAMDQQAQDRCHRIGQTREVHIYRLISESTIEENILKKANQKRALDDLVIQSGGYNTEFFKKLDPMELFSGHRSLPIKNVQKERNYNGNEISLSNADVEAALKHAEDEADYMALKKVEQEEEVENEEFTEETIGRLEDDELVNEDDVRVDEPADHSGWMISSNKENVSMQNRSDTNEEKVLTVVVKEDDVDMLDDVKQMAAAAAAAGQAISSFENHLRPIDRYAIRFLELWDPIIDKATVESQVGYEETEWELDRIEKYKEEMEAEIDEDEEPLVYERWDSDFATEAYRQQVEALAQHQLMEDLECEAREREDEEAENRDSMNRNDMPSDLKPKAKKKPKKAKFKSLKKGSLASGSKSVKEEPSADAMSMDEDTFSQEMLTFSDAASPHSVMKKKRKKVEITINGSEEKTSKKKSKKLKRSTVEICSLDLDTDFPVVQHDGLTDSKPAESVVESEQRPLNRSKMGGKISITSMPLKRVLMIKPEKLKKGNVWSRDCVPSPDVWLPMEDAILCAVVHEYGPYWNLVSDILYSMTAGGFHRGRYRHPVHCCERFRELIQRYILSSSDNPNHEKVSNAGSGKALLKVTEENIRTLLDIAAEQPDPELLLQKHFTALLSTVWKMNSRVDRLKNLASSRNSVFSGGKKFSSGNQISHTSVREPGERLKFIILGKSSRIVAAALDNVDSRKQDDKASPSNHSRDISANTERLDITLEFQGEMGDTLASLPSILNLTIIGSDPLSFVSKDEGVDHLRTSIHVAENRSRAATRACLEDRLGWASSAFPTNDIRPRSAAKLPSLGKHKLPFPDLNKPSKSKFKKSAENGELRHLPGEQNILQPLPTMASPIDLNLFSPSSPLSTDIQIDDLEINSLTDMDKLTPLEEDGFETVEHNYVPDFITGLDDCTLFPEFTDIG
ncbi:protein PHOTOPERIOD-INDEPENDENT EARLY FLOWERING 1 isoform X3 [Humulus lupulus]|uniref:protein PHOTOPERIOD-INDEPENDENT EARLY FLOWERING 1 isoform X3 n=1 Tax=Humulus lupulus TaxID=3486 RepID=UPI002B40DCDA|nr:protein PHOTOPERIOD-INDEPENDENT EARLY FLOWERING 1 isoform X3 [Humulus lupulus]